MTTVEAPHNLNFLAVGMTIVSVDRLVLDSYLALHNRKLAILKNSLLWEVVAAEKQGRTGAQEWFKMQLTGVMRMPVRLVA